MAACVEDFPDPVGPVISTRPRGNIEMSLNIAPKPSSLSVGTVEGIDLKTAAYPRFCLNTFLMSL